jgi:hypothetical protein
MTWGGGGDGVDRATVDLSNMRTGMPSVNWPELLGSVGITIVTAAAAAAGFVKFFGGKMVNHQFDRRLEAFKSELAANQAHSLERLRFDVSASLDRTAKLHQHEFEVLPTAWRLVQQAVAATHTVTSMWTMTYDIVSFGPKERLEIYEKREYTPSQREHIEAGVAKGIIAGQEALNVVEYHVRRRAATTMHSTLHNYLLDHGIFIQAELRDRFRAVDDMIYAALREHDEDQAGGLEGGTLESRRRHRDALETEWLRLRDEIENELQARLWNSRLPAVDQRPSSTVVAEQPTH